MHILKNLIKQFSFLILGIGKHANGHHSKLPMAPIAITLIDEYYDRVRLRLGYLKW